MIIWLYNIQMSTLLCGLYSLFLLIALGKTLYTGYLHLNLQDIFTVLLLLKHWDTSRLGAMILFCVYNIWIFTVLMLYANEKKMSVFLVKIERTAIEYF